MSSALDDVDEEKVASESGLSETSLSKESREEFAVDRQNKKSDSSSIHPVGKISKRRSVTNRVLTAFALLITFFVSVTAWGIWAQHEAAREAELLRSGYLPVSLALRNLIATQGDINVQLNHVTSERAFLTNRVWFESAVRVGRNKMAGTVRASLHHLRNLGGDSEAALIDEVYRALVDLEAQSRRDEENLDHLFDALQIDDKQTAESYRERLVVEGHRLQSRLRKLESRARDAVDFLSVSARRRERGAQRLMAVGLGASIAVGFLVLLYMRSLLAPLGRVTKRARDVARGDLSRRPVSQRNDEFGELEASFEKMLEEIEEANAQRLETERFAAVGKMAAKVTHEIRNPLSSIALNLELLEEDLQEADPAIRKILSSVVGEVARLGELSSHYLSLARAQENHRKPCLLSELLQDTLRFAAPELHSGGAHCALEIQDEGHTEALLDPAQIRQVLLNLLRNAVEAMPNGGEILVKLEILSDWAWPVDIKTACRIERRTH